jgi:hypothetical protein
MSAGLENEAAVSRQLADPDSELPPGARRMTQKEREERVTAILDALAKQVQGRENAYPFRVRRERRDKGGVGMTGSGGPRA